jgi:hypothetical protein
LEQIGAINFKLKLLAKSHLHPVFHISLLEPTKGDTPLATSKELQPEFKDKKYKVKKIIDTRTNTQGQQEYLVK